MAWPLFRIGGRFDIVKMVDGQETLYLRRYFLFRSRFFNIYLHYIARPDEDRDPHCHPWNFTTLILRGGYTDEAWSLRDGKITVENEPLRAGAIRHRKAEHVHRVRNVLPGTWTLVFCGPKRRSWGFWDKDTWEWTHWRDYLGEAAQNEPD